MNQKIALILALLAVLVLSGCEAKFEENKSTNASFTESQANGSELPVVGTFCDSGDCIELHPFRIESLNKTCIAGINKVVLDDRYGMLDCD